MNLARFLPDGERGHPDRDEAVLAEWQAEFGMADDLKEESAVAASMRSLASGRTAQRYTAEDERPGMEGKFLFAIVTLLADETDNLDLPQLAFGYREGRRVDANYG